MVDLASSLRNDPLYDIQQLGIALEAHIQLGHHPVLLDKYGIVSIDHDLGDLIICQDRIQDPVTADGIKYHGAYLRLIRDPDTSVACPEADLFPDLLLQFLISKGIQIQVLIDPCADLLG